MLLLVEVLVPNKFLQTQNLNYGLVMSKFKRLITKLERIEEELQNHVSVDTDLKHFLQAKHLISFASKAMSLARRTRTASDVDQDVDKIISTFILTTGKPFINDLMTEIEKAMNETSPVLSAFDMFNPQSSDMSYSTRK